MKRLISVIVLCCVFAVTASATDVIKGDAYVCDGNVEFVFYNDNLTESQKEAIISQILNGTSETDYETCGLLCTLFGHSEEVSTTEKITHEVYASSPRCVAKTYQTTTCSRCDYAESVLISTNRVVCCP